jgi:hypothetical protein
MNFVIETYQVEPNAEGNPFRVVGKAQDSPDRPAGSIDTVMAYSLDRAAADTLAASLNEKSVLLKYYRARRESDPTDAFAAGMIVLIGSQIDDHMEDDPDPVNITHLFRNVL